MPRFGLGTLLIVLALLPPFMAWAWTERGDLKAMVMSGMDTLPVALFVGVTAILLSVIAAAIAVEATAAAIHKLRRRS